MKVTIDLDYDDRDKLMVDMLIEDYETLYHNCYNDMEEYTKNPEKHHFKLEDLKNNEKTLMSIERLLDYYTAGNEHKNIIKRIIDKVRIKGDIARGMSQK